MLRPRAKPPTIVAVAGGRSTVVAPKNLTSSHIALAVKTHGGGSVRTTRGCCWIAAQVRHRMSTSDAEVRIHQQGMDCVPRGTSRLPHFSKPVSRIVFRLVGDISGGWDCRHHCARCETTAGSWSAWSRNHNRWNAVLFVSL